MGWIRKTVWRCPLSRRRRKDGFCRGANEDHPEQSEARAERGCKTVSAAQRTTAPFLGSVRCRCERCCVKVLDDLFCAHGAKSLAAVPILRNWASLPRKDSRHGTRCEETLLGRPSSRRAAILVMHSVEGSDKSRSTSFVTKRTATDRSTTSSRCAGRLRGSDEPHLASQIDPSADMRTLRTGAPLEWHALAVSQIGPAGSPASNPGEKRTDTDRYASCGRLWRRKMATPGNRSRCKIRRQTGIGWSGCLPSRRLLSQLRGTDRQPMNLPPLTKRQSNRGSTRGAHEPRDQPVQQSYILRTTHEPSTLCSATVLKSSGSGLDFDHRFCPSG